MTKNFFSLGLLILVITFSISTFAQNTSEPQSEQGGQYPISMNDASHPCITSQQYELIEKQIAVNVKALKLDTMQHKTTSTLFGWPLQPASGLTDCSYYYIGNYVDEDPSSPGIKDYNCGAVTYDGHRGTDICSAPYPFLKMDNNLLNVVAAAPGTIIQKSDGYFDRNCAMSTDTANYIIIQHADGSVALYWHMKKFSLTGKFVGQTVSLGEFLGVVGSSGSSTAPHLHFEVWGSTTSSTLKDPWAGTCNSLGGTTLWTAQKPYTEPAVIKAQVNSSLAILPGCDTTETPNEDSCFGPGVTAKFLFFLRNETPGDTVHERIVNPGGSTFSSWTHNSNASHLASYWYWNKVLPSTPGTYTYETIYNGITCSKNFYVSCGVLDMANTNALQQVNLSPNPAGNTVNVDMQGVDNGNYSISIKNIIGQTLVTDIAFVENNTVQKTYSITALPNGIYFLSIESEKSKIVKIIIKQN